MGEGDGMALDEKVRGGEKERDLLFDRQRDFGKWPSAAEKQPLAGFDAEYVDILDYIVRSTHKIWEEHGIGLIYNHYKHNTPVHASSGLNYGRERVIVNTIQSQAALPDAVTHAEAYGRGNYLAYVLSVLAMFPDAAVQIDDLYWNGNERDGYRTAVRWTLLGTHTGPGIYGAPTNQQVQMNGITQQRVQNGRFVEEYTLFNELQILQQLWFGR